VFDGQKGRSYRGRLLRFSARQKVVSLGPVCSIQPATFSGQDKALLSI
jgi:hypothetical protein